jgi:hypothetical protein
MTTHAQEVLDRAFRLEKWSRDEVERFLLLEKLGRVDVVKDADGNTVALKSTLFCQELQQSVSELLPQMRQVSKWQLSFDDRNKLAYVMKFFEEVLSKMG